MSHSSESTDKAGSLLVGGYFAANSSLITQNSSLLLAGDTPGHIADDTSNDRVDRVPVESVL
jgi:hypothetical protein